MSEADAGEPAAGDLLRTLRRLDFEAQPIVCYLIVRVALDAGVLELISSEVSSTGRLVCRERDTGQQYIANRPAEWSAKETDEYVAHMKERLAPA